MRSGQNPASWQSYLAPPLSLEEGYVLVINWVGANFESFEHQVQSTILSTSSAYNSSMVEVTYYNACICSSITALLGDPGAQTPVSFQMLLYELTWGCYQGQPSPPLPSSSNSSFPPIEKVNIRPPLTPRSLDTPTPETPTKGRETVGTANL